MEHLHHLNRRAARPIAVLLQSAAANAGNKDGMDTENLVVARIVVNEGPTWKRIMPRAMGRASMILKRTSHVEVTLKDLPPVVSPAAKAPETEAGTAAREDGSTKTGKSTAKKKSSKTGKGAAEQAKAASKPRKDAKKNPASAASKKSGGSRGKPKKGA
jgi:large subunit ribosomal protein L22